MRVFVVGVTGRIGGLLARRLADAGDEVRGLVRRAEQRQELAVHGIRAEVGDLTALSAAELVSLLDGSEVVVFAAGTEGDDAAAIRAVDHDAALTTLDAVGRAGIRRLVTVSVIPEGWRERTLGPELELYFATKKRIDVEVSRRDLDWLIVRPSELSDEPGTGRVALGPAELHETIPRADVAATLAALVHTPSIRRRILELNRGATPVAEAVARLMS